VSNELGHSGNHTFIPDGRGASSGGRGGQRTNGNAFVALKRQRNDKE